MELKKEFVKNYLSKKHYNSGLIWAASLLAFCLIMSNLYWFYDIGEYLEARPSLVFEKHQWWRLFTSSFIHGDLSHLLSNSLMLMLMGYFVASYYGAWVFPGLSFIAGALINYFTLQTHSADIALVGASGVVYFLWGFWLLLFLFIQRHVSIARRLMKIVAISLLVLVPTSYHANVSYKAHGIGLILGVVFGFFYYLLKRKKIHSYEQFRFVKVDEYDEEDTSWELDSESSETNDANGTQNYLQ